MKFYKEYGIAQQFTNPYTPRRNGISERNNRTLVESIQYILLTAKLPNSFRVDVVSTACHIQKNSFTSSLNNKIPLTMWCKKSILC